MTKRIRRDERGSIPITVGVIAVSSILVVALLDVANFGLRLSRRAGDSANALQLADAGVNDAVKAVATATGTMINETKDLGAAGSYTYTATLDASAQMWHIVATGIDRTGMRRRIKADAVAESLFGNAFFVQASAIFQSGVSVDSYINGQSTLNMCTRKGTIGTNDPNNLAFSNNGQGTGVRNCVETVHGVAWPHPVDGCIAYGDGTQPLPPNTGGTGWCPPAPATQKQTPEYVPPQVQSPGGASVNPPTCDASNPIVGGQRYFWNKVELTDGCFVDARNGPAIIFTDGPITIGTGNGHKVNQPPNSGHVQSTLFNGTLCPPDAGLKDFRNNPSSYYCSGWASTLQIYKVNGTSGSVNFRNHAKFWGIVVAPSAAFFSAHTGTPQVEVWGAFIANNGNSAAQMTLHYDEALGSITTGRFKLRNWREEPINS